MESLKELHPIALEEMNKRFSPTPLTLKYPFPKRPARTLGLLEFDGRIFTSEKFARVVMLKVTPPFFVKASSTFLRPRVELGLPFFDAELVIFGKRRMFMVDIQRPGDLTWDGDDALYDRLLQIREKYPELLKKSIKIKGEIQSVFSKAACQVMLSEKLDGQAIGIFRDFFHEYLDLVEKSKPLSGDALERAKQAFQQYADKVVTHDPGVKAFTLFFGKKEGMGRTEEIFFAQ